jgi:hypothetical protein
MGRQKSQMTIKVKDINKRTREKTQKHKNTKKFRRNSITNKILL